MALCQLESLQTSMISSVASYMSSIRFIRKLVGVSLCNIVYHRIDLDTAAAFEPFSVGDFKCMTFKSGTTHPLCVDVYYYNKGVKEAITNKYLRELYLIFKDKDSDKILENYKFSFSYKEAPASDVLPTSEDVIKATKHFMQSIEYLGRFKKLSGNIQASVELLFFDEATPENYTPPYFTRDCPTVPLILRLPDTRTKLPLKLGTVSTGYHTMKCRAVADCFAGLTASTPTSARSSVLDNLERNFPDFDFNQDAVQHRVSEGTDGMEEVNNNFQEVATQERKTTALSLKKEEDVVRKRKRSQEGREHKEDQDRKGDQRQTEDLKLKEDMVQKENIEQREDSKQEEDHEPEDNKQKKKINGNIERVYSISDESEISEDKESSLQENQIVNSAAYACLCQINATIPEIDKVRCSVCRMFQHSVCAGYERAVFVPDSYVCLNCGKPTKPATDAALARQSRSAWNLISVFRLILVHCKKFKTVPTRLLNRLPLEKQSSMFNKILKMNILIQKGNTFEVNYPKVQVCMMTTFNQQAVPDSMVLQEDTQEVLELDDSFSERSNVQAEFSTTDKCL